MKELQFLKDKLTQYPQYSFNFIHTNKKEEELYKVELMRERVSFYIKTSNKSEKETKEDITDYLITELVPNLIKMMDREKKKTCSIILRDIITFEDDTYYATIFFTFDEE